MTAARRQSQTRPATPGDARAYLDKARKFLRAEYDPDPISASEAKAAVTAAARMVRIAELAVGQVER